MREPDWAFMDAFVAEMRAEVENSLDAMMTLSYYYAAI